MDGQISLFDYMEANLPIREPCKRPCDVEWCSKICFIRRGYMWNYGDWGWIKGKDGKPLVSKNKSCDWTPKELQEMEVGK